MTLCYCNTELSVKTAPDSFCRMKISPRPVRAFFMKHRLPIPTGHEIYSRRGIIPTEYYIVRYFFLYDSAVRQRRSHDGYTIMTGSFRFRGVMSPLFWFRTSVTGTVTSQTPFPIEAISWSIRYSPSPVSPASASLSIMDLNSFSSSCCSATYHCRKLKVG